MTRPSVNDDTQNSLDYQLNIPISVAVPISQSAFPITEQQWRQLKGQIKRIKCSESQWFTASLAFLAFGISFLIAILLPGSEQLWVTIFLWAGMLTGIACGVLSFVAYKATRGDREDDIKAILRHMDQIEQIYRE